MNDSTVVQLESPRFETIDPLLVAGLQEPYTVEKMKNIPAQWQRFVSALSRVPHQAAGATYGVWFNVLSDAETFDYLTGVQVSDITSLPDEFSHAHIPAQRYAVFRHKGHVSKLRDTMNAIKETWLPERGYEVGCDAQDAPDFFERYGPGFNPQTGLGDIEVWIPIKPSKR